MIIFLFILLVVIILLLKFYLVVIMELVWLINFVGGKELVLKDDEDVDVLELVGMG